MCLLKLRGVGDWSQLELSMCDKKKGTRKVQEVPQLQAADHPRHKEEEETDKTKQAQIKQTYEKH